MTSAQTGFDLVPVTLSDPGVDTLEVRARNGSPLEFHRAPATPPGDRLLDLLDVVRGAVRDGNLVLLPGFRVRQVGRDFDDGLYMFVGSIVDCAALVRTGGPLVGPRSAVRLLCSLLAPMPSPEAIIETPPVQIDYRHLSWLWTDKEAFKQGKAAGDFRWLDMIALGKALGEAHSKGVLHGDTHQGNFVVDAGVHVTWFDLEHTRFLYGPAESAQCATDLLPLMTGLTAWDWYNVKRGYLASWPDGDRVFDLIETRDRTGWMQAHRRRDYRRTLHLLDQAQRLADVDDVTELARLEDRRSWCYLNLGEHDLALRAQTEAIRLAEDHGLPGLSWYILNLALLYRNTGRDQLARATLDAFLARTDRVAEDVQAREHGRKVLDQILSEDKS